MGVGLIASSVYSSIRQAEALAYGKFPVNEIYNGRGDALRHCYLSALLFRNRGEDFATDFMNAHEEVGGNPPAEEAMDRFNNAVGRHIAFKNPNATEEEIGELCAMAVLAGRTQVLSGPGKNTTCTMLNP